MGRISNPDDTIQKIYDRRNESRFEISIFSKEKIHKVYPNKQTEIRLS